MILLVRLITFEAYSNMERQCVLFLQQSNSCLLTIRQNARKFMFSQSCRHSDCPQSFQSTTYVHAIVWGLTPRYRLILAISPLAIMTATMIIILVSLYKARYLDLDYIASFNAMDSLHLITACSSGNVHTVSFPDYSQDIGLFSKDVEVGLSEKKAGSGATGFHFSLS